MRPLAFFCGGISLGIALGQLWGWTAGPCLLAGLSAAGAGLFSGRALGRRRLSLCLLGMALGLFQNALYLRCVSAPMERLAGTEQTLTMTLTEYPVPAAFGAKVTVRGEGLPGKLMYYAGADLLSLAPGQQVRSAVRLQSAGRIRDTDVTVFTSKGVFLLAYGKGTPETLPGGGGVFGYVPQRLARAAQQRLAVLFSGDTLGFVLALLTGQRGQVSVQADSDLSESGIYHVLAVSGMHCVYLLALVRLLVGHHRQRLSAGAGIAALVFYAFFTGASPSVVRACIMLSMLTAAPLLGRKSDAPTAMLTALSLILLQNPYAIGSVSLQLSFAAVAGLIYLSPGLHRGLCSIGPEGGRIAAACRGSIAATAACLLTTAPITAWYFGRLILVSFLSNLLCLWAVAGAFSGAMAAVLVSLVSMPLGRLAAMLTDLCIQYILQLCHILAALPCHGVYFLTPWLKGWLVLVYVMTAALYLLPSRRRRRSVALAAVLWAVTLWISLWAGRRPFQHDLDAAVVDVGQGQCVLLKSGQAAALVDCGSANSWYDPGTQASDLLAVLGCHRLEQVVLTHLDTDHTSGLDRLWARTRIETLILPEAAKGSEAASALQATARSYGTQVTFLQQETVLPLGRARLRILPAIGGSTSNQQGLAVLASVGTEDLLITGDLNQSGEKRLLSAYDLPEIEVFTAGHHGAKDASSQELLAALRPKTAVISVGANSYGHPAEQTMQRLARSGCAIYRTDRHGTVYIAFDEGGT